MLVTLNEILPQAREQHYAVGAFDCTEDVMIRTMLDTAEQEQAPIILMALEHDLKGRGIRYIAGLVHAVADSYSIPIVLHLDHAENVDIIKKAIEHGFTSVMFDGSQLPVEQNIAISRQVVELAHPHGVTVEAELGIVAGKDIYGEDYPDQGRSQLTEPRDVVDFVKKTGVDALAVSIGTSHGIYVAKPTLDIERLKAIEAVSQVPLVLHGGSGTPEDQVQQAIRYGITKLNVYSDSRIAMFRGMKQSVTIEKREDPLPDIMFRPIRNSLSQLIADRIRLFSSNNKASTKLLQPALASRGKFSGIKPAELAQYIDHTLLKPEATRPAYDQLCQEAKRYHFKSVCVNSGWVPYVVRQLQGTGVTVCAVIGFPLGAMDSQAKAFEARCAIGSGAKELDMVMNIDALKSRQLKMVEADMRAVRRAAGDKIVLKVIIETALLTDEEKVLACEIAKKAGADFVKTCTGFAGGGATVADIALMRKIVGPNMGVKASGGVRDYDKAVAMLNSGANRIGAVAGVAIVTGVRASSPGY
jgi:deoxyribose-phosphate aldolase